MEKTVRRLVRDELRFRTKLAVLEYARECGKDTKAWREFEVPKSASNLWKKANATEGRVGLKRKKPGALLTPNGFPHKLLRKFFRSGAPINWVLSASCGTRSAIMESVYHNQVYTLILASKGLNRLPETATRRTIHSRHYAKTVTGFPT